MKFIRLMKSRVMRGAGRVEGMGEGRDCTFIVVEGMGEGRDCTFIVVEKLGKEITGKK
jgi:hypothetical protein